MLPEKRVDLYKVVPNPYDLANSAKNVKTYTYNLDWFDDLEKALVACRWLSESACGSHIAKVVFTLFRRDLGDQLVGDKLYKQNVIPVLTIVDGSVIYEYREQQGTLSVLEFFRVTQPPVKVVTYYRFFVEDCMYVWDEGRFWKERTTLRAEEVVYTLAKKR